MTTTTLTDEEQVAALRAKGVGEECIRRWRAGGVSSVSGRYEPAWTQVIENVTQTTQDPPIAAPRARQTAPRGPVPSEASVQRSIVRYLKARGLCVYRVGQRNARGTQDAGISDLLCFSGRGVYFVEVKSRTGKQSEAQKRFQEMVRRAGGTYICARSINDVEGVQ